MWKLLSHAQLFVTLQTTPLSMGFSREEYWNGFPCPPPGDLPNPRIQSASLGSPALGGEFFTASTPGEAHKYRLRWCLSSKESACYAGATGDMGFDPCVRQIPWKRAWDLHVLPCLGFSLELHRVILRSLAFTGKGKHGKHINFYITSCLTKMIYMEVGNQMRFGNQQYCSENCLHGISLF